MPNRYFNLTPDLDEFLCARVEGGRYANTSELVQAALRALEREERAREKTRIQWQATVDEEYARHIAGIDVFRELWLNQQQPQASQDSFAEPSPSWISTGL